VINRSTPPAVLAIRVLSQLAQKECQPKIQFTFILIYAIILMVDRKFTQNTTGTAAW